jgi:hypothetical protein
MIYSCVQNGGVIGNGATIAPRIISTGTGLLTATGTRVVQIDFGRAKAVIGIQGNSGSVNAWPEDIMCIAIYDRALTDTERAKIEANMRKHYGI